MRILIIIMITVLTLFMTSYILPTQEEYEIYESTIRLHVLANSDSKEDQALKLKVRDAILKRANTYDTDNKEIALEKIKEEKNELIKIAKSVIEKEGKSYDVSIEIGQESYPKREYEGFSLPAGEYTSVRVLIGEGAGKNWWCVLYPPLCTSLATEYDEESCLEVGLTKNQYDLITSNEKGQYKIKFKLLEIASEAFGFIYD